MNASRNAGKKMQHEITALGSTSSTTDVNVEHTDVNVEPAITVPVDPVFLNESFNALSFVGDAIRRADGCLEEVRDDMQLQAANVRAAMGEELKRESEPIINLAEALTNIDGQLGALKKPAGKLFAGILEIHDRSKSTRALFEEQLKNLESASQRRGNILAQKRLAYAHKALNDYLDANDSKSITVSCDSTLLKRHVDSFGVELYFCGLAGVVRDTEHDKLFTRAANLLTDLFMAADEAGNETVMIDCLRLLVHMRAEVYIMDEYIKRKVRPRLREILAPVARDVKQHDNLETMYESIMSVLEVDMAKLLNVSSRNEFCHINWPLAVFFPEVDEQLADRFAEITAPGNPELFKKRYCATFDFFARLTRHCVSDAPPDHVIASQFLRKFPLNVYFEICYQQISSSLESAFIQTVAKPGVLPQRDDTPNAKYLFKMTSAYVEAVERCMSPNTYLNRVGDQFVKLTMLLLSRYLSWFGTLMRLSSANQLQVPIECALDGVSDLRQVQRLFDPPSEGSVAPLLGTTCHLRFHDVLLQVQTLNVQLIEAAIGSLKRHVVATKTVEITALLEQIAVIPRQYRRTNRDRPSAASKYVTLALERLTGFWAQCEPELDDQKSTMGVEVLAGATAFYRAQVDEVLRSVTLTEMSLKRLKKRGAGASEGNVGIETAADNVTDEMKIREQIRLDVLHFADKCYPLGNQISKEQLDALRVNVNQPQP